MDRNKLNEEWKQLAPAWIKEVRNGTNAARTGFLDQAMLDACGDVRGLDILDSGCGEGRFCRMLLDRGAGQVLGLDLCQQMVAAAKDLESGRDGYQVADVQNLSSLPDDSFDLAISYLNQCDLPDFEANTREVSRVLKTGGRFIVANLHPMRSAVGNWHRTDDGVKQHIILDRYFEEGERHWLMLGVQFTNFHRTLSTYILGFRQSGFAIDQIIEPTVNAGNLERYPELDDERRVPNFIIFVLTKIRR